MAFRTIPRWLTGLLFLLGIVVAIYIYGYIVIGNPVARQRSKTTSCLAQVRRITQAIEMYAQDHGRYPDTHWAAEIEDNVGSRKIYLCPSDIAWTGMPNQISYALNPDLVRDGKGIPTGDVMAPAKVGVIADAFPPDIKESKGYCFGQVVAFEQGTTYTRHIAVTFNPRHGGVVTGFADGHVELITWKDPTQNNPPPALVDAFMKAAARGWITRSAPRPPRPAPHPDSTTPRLPAVPRRG